MFLYKFHLKILMYIYRGGFKCFNLKSSGMIETKIITFEKTINLGLFFFIN
jgi:hypothetical protein